MISSAPNRLALATALCLTAAFAAEAVAQPVKFSPHRAVYDIALARTGAASGVNELDGRLVYELKGSACEGYEQSMRFVTRTSSQDGELQVTDLRTTSWEDAPAKRLRFTSRNYQNAKLSEETQGDAKRTDAASPATVEIVKPSRAESGLPANVYFPIQHSIAVIEAARKGNLMLAADLYDGSDSGRKIYNTSTVIGFEGKAGTLKFPDLPGTGDRLSQTASWPVSISYFDKKAGKGDAVPSYEMSYRFHENGVTSQLTIDHGEFAFKGKLKELTFLPETACPTK
ncbi:MAG: cell envelope integrity EipB family protein [Hyphomicrobiaceae bacterium]|nr:cell envelope integrity EipB family protein [Hyphomicrobiaceae bacterium]